LTATPRTSSRPSSPEPAGRQPQSRSGRRWDSTAPTPTDARSPNTIALGLGVRRVSGSSYGCRPGVRRALMGGLWRRVRFFRAWASVRLRRRVNCCLLGVAVSGLGWTAR
jgi:hypothetical protein